MKYILNDYASDYKSRLKCLQFLPLMYFFELNNIYNAFYQNSSPSYWVFQHQKLLHLLRLKHQIFLTLKLKHAFAKSLSNSSRNFYIFQLPHLWNSLSPINLESSPASIRSPLISFFGPTLTHTLTLPITALITANAHAQNIYHHSVLPTSLLKYLYIHVVPHPRLSTVLVFMPTMSLHHYTVPLHFTHALFKISVPCALWNNKSNQIESWVQRYIIFVTTIYN